MTSLPEARWAPPRPHVHSLALELTGFCNQSCDYCFNAYRADGGASVGSAETETLPARVDRILEAVDLEHVTLTGGEPLASHDLFAVLDARRPGANARSVRQDRARHRTAHRASRPGAGIDRDHPHQRRSRRRLPSRMHRRIASHRTRRAHGRGLRRPSSFAPARHLDAPRNAGNQHRRQAARSAIALSCLGETFASTELTMLRDRAVGPVVRRDFGVPSGADARGWVRRGHSWTPERSHAARTPATRIGGRKSDGRTHRSACARCVDRRDPRTTRVR